VELVLCRDVYHCTPSELDEQDWGRVAAHLICLDVEAKLRKKQQEEAEHRRK
jgi:hypothetical protein